MTRYKLALALLASAFAASALAQQPAATGGAVVASEPGKATIARAAEMSAQVVGIDKTTRTVTLKGPKGNTMDVVAGDDVHGVALRPLERDRAGRLVDPDDLGGHLGRPGDRGLAGLAGDDGAAGRGGLLRERAGGECAGEQRECKLVSGHEDGLHRVEEQRRARKRRRANFAGPCQRSALSNFSSNSLAGTWSASTAIIGAAAASASGTIAALPISIVRIRCTDS